MAVEQHGDAREEVPEEREAGAELVDDYGGRGQGLQLRGEVNVQEEVELAENGAEDRQAGEDGGGEEVVSADADVEGSWRARC